MKIEWKAYRPGPGGIELGGVVGNIPRDQLGSFPAPLIRLQFQQAVNEYVQRGRDTLSLCTILGITPEYAAELLAMYEQKGVSRQTVIAKCARGWTPWGGYPKHVTADEAAHFSLMYYRYCNPSRIRRLWCWVTRHKYTNISGVLETFCERCGAKQ